MSTAPFWADPQYLAMRRRQRELLNQWHAEAVAKGFINPVGDAYLSPDDAWADTAWNCAEWDRLERELKSHLHFRGMEVIYEDYPQPPIEETVVHIDYVHDAVYDIIALLDLCEDPSPRVREFFDGLVDGDG